MSDDRDILRTRAKALQLHGLVAHWQEALTEGWVPSLVDWEEEERARRSLERRLREARIGRFKPLCDFDWKWPRRCDRAAIEALMSLDFLKDATNVVLVGPNGIGKTLVAKNIAHQALIHGHSVLFTTAGQLLGDLAALDSDSALRRRVRHYARPRLLVIDEVGYLSYSNRHADLLFELISRRYEQTSTIVTTNRPLPNGVRSSPTLPASSRWSIASSITPRSSPSTASPTVSKRPKNAPMRARLSAAEASHEPPSDTSHHARCLPRSPRDNRDRMANRGAVERTSRWHHRR